MRIEVGYGLEGVLTDIRAKDIIDNIMRPKFKEEKYSEGIYNAVLAITQVIEKGSYVPNLAVKEESDILSDILIYIFSISVFIFAVYIFFPFILLIFLFLIFDYFINNFIISFLLSGIITFFLMKSIKIGGSSLSSHYGNTFSGSGGSWSSGGSSWGGFGGGMSGGGGASGSW